MAVNKYKESMIKICENLQADKQKLKNTVVDIFVRRQGHLYDNTLESYNDFEMTVTIQIIQYQFTSIKNLPPVPVTPPVWQVFDIT
ncbi:hypothetical protein RUM44_011518 [Polyplax serrata]|uniref:Uncharacterized protein n=1 Tax=Polyplax serrata TaxID=468196 RepID=A0ABR1AQK5_POLSC